MLSITTLKISILLSLTLTLPLLPTLNLANTKLPQTGLCCLGLQMKFKVELTQLGWPILNLIRSTSIPTAELISENQANVLKLQDPTRN
jgi:hypothetical protein